MKYPDTELQDALAASADDILTDLAARRAAPDYTPPHADLGYCACGTVWNIEAMAAEKFVKGKCPDCGEPAVEIEKSR